MNKEKNITDKEIKKILSTIPKTPGIYKMIDTTGRVIYIGKAKELSKRVKQYFKKDYQHSTRTKKLVENIVDIQTISVDTELEAIMLENNLIKQLQPKYNILLKDDKSYVYIKITKEDFPRVQIVRKIEKDGAKYIGPKTAKHKVQETLKVLKKIFPFRHCNLNIDFIEKDPNNERHKVKLSHKTIKYPCLDHYIKRCISPCIGKCTKEEYSEIIKNIENFLAGKADTIIKQLKEKMTEEAAVKKFEKAAKTRDKILKIESILEKQKVSDHNQTDKDIINYCIIQKKAYFNLFQIRDGKLINQENFKLSAAELEESEHKEILEAFMTQYYEIATDIGKEILIPHELVNNQEIEKFIQEKSKIKTKLLVPKIGTKNKLLEMSLKNAQIYADKNRPKWQEENELTKNATIELQKLLKIKNQLKRIECYDISHLSGTDTVGSMVVFQNGAPKTELYRQFKIRTLTGDPDDYKSMEEVLTRRLIKIKEKIASEKYILKKVRKKDLEFIDSTTNPKKRFLEKEFKIASEKSLKIQKNIKETKIIEKEKKSKTIREEENKKIKYKNYYTLIKDDEAKAYGQITELSEKVTLISHIFVSKKERGKKLGYKLIKELIKKSKSKRCYIICKPELKDYYFKMGFEEIKKIPKEITELEKYKNPKILDKKLKIVFDKIKLKEDKSFSQVPDLIIIDGGKGQLKAGTKVFKKLDIKGIPYISLAKRLEEIFIPGKEKSIILPRNNEALKLVQRARDEAHRFAITFNKKLRRPKFQ